MWYRGVRQSFALGSWAGFSEPAPPRAIRRQGWLAAGGRRPWVGLLALGAGSLSSSRGVRVMLRLGSDPVTTLLDGGFSTVGCSGLGLARPSLTFSRIRWLI